MTIRTHEANALRGVPRRRAAAALIVATALFACLVVAGVATAKPAASNPEATASVIGGHGTEVANFPAIAYIEGAQATDGYACTGTVVAPRVVLTAGHCVEDLESSSIVEPSEIRVATGISNLEHIPPEKVSLVSQVLVYPHFDPALLHGDAGLLILSSPVAAKPIELAGKTDGSLYSAGRKLKVAGWGIDRFDGNDQAHIPDQLQSAVVPIDAARGCSNGVSRFYGFFDAARQLCTLDSPQFKVTPCNGDSGGPAIATRSDGTPVEVGIVSMGDFTCSPDSPAVYTRVDQISTWVKRWIDAVESGGPTPTVKVPIAHIPTLTRERAEELSFLVLEEAFKGRFANGQERTIRCVRQAKSQLKCGLTWYEGPNDYYGRVNVFYAIRHNVVLVGAHYAVHWVDDDCYFHGEDPESCRVHSKQQ
ncbi:MAG TPA: serine protease [Solirubrobacterales bacterium]|nr:serine protease [Solirubrobacterales bacterium]